MFIDGPISGPHLVHKMLELKDVAVFRLPGVLYGWILQSDLTLPCDFFYFLRLGVAVSWEMKVVPIRCLAAFDSVLGFFCHQRSTDTSKRFLKTSRHIANFRKTFSHTHTHTQIHFPTSNNKLQEKFREGQQEAQAVRLLHDGRVRHLQQRPSREF